VADIAWYVFMGWVKSGILDGVTKESFDQFPKLTALFNTVYTNEKVNAWNVAHNIKY
jgi:hypothetical protein